MSEEVQAFGASAVAGGNAMRPLDTLISQRIKHLKKS